MSWLTADLPGTGGHYKEVAQDFKVDEIPLYPCSGAGDHLYLKIEKINTGTREIIHQLTRKLAIKESEIGYAGLKDSRALTRQTISVPLSCEGRLNDLELNGGRILNVDRHSNKLRLGHLAGNHFKITLRDVKPQAPERAAAILDRLQRAGVPNTFGEQRYGVLGNSARLGELLLRRQYEDFCTEMLGDPELIRNPAWRQAATLYRQNRLKEACSALPTRMRDERQLIRTLLKSASHRDAVLHLSRNLLRLFLSALQSALFDAILQQRLHALDQLFDGDIAIKHDNGACFRVQQAKEEQARAERFEISPTAPLFGSKLMLAEGQQGQLEHNILDQRGLSLDSWKTETGIKIRGERRAMRVQLTDVQSSHEQNDLLNLSFSLPRGSYATSVLKEIIK